MNEGSGPDVDEDLIVRTLKIAVPEGIEVERTKGIVYRLTAKDCVHAARMCSLGETHLCVTTEEERKKYGLIPAEGKELPRIK